MNELTLETELVDLLTSARQALEGIVALDDEDAGPDGESLTCLEVVQRIDAYLKRKGRGDG